MTGGGIAQLARVLGSYPIGRWFESCCRYHSWPVGQEVKTPPFHGGIMGSIPVRVTKSYARKQRKCVVSEFLFFPKIHSTTYLPLILKITAFDYLLAVFYVPRKACALRLFLCPENLSELFFFLLVLIFVGALCAVLGVLFFFRFNLVREA